MFVKMLIIIIQKLGRSQRAWFLQHDHRVYGKKEFQKKMKKLERDRDTKMRRHVFNYSEECPLIFAEKSPFQIFHVDLETPCIYYTNFSYHVCHKK